MCCCRREWGSNGGLWVVGCRLIEGDVYPWSCGGLSLIVLCVSKRLSPIPALTDRSITPVANATNAHPAPVFRRYYKPIKRHGSEDGGQMSAGRISSAWETEEAVRVPARGGRRRQQERSLG